MDIKNQIPKLKKYIPAFNAYGFDSAFAILPHLGLQWYKYQGKSSAGCLKFQIVFYWLMFGVAAQWKHEELLSFNTECSELLIIYE